MMKHHIATRLKFNSLLDAVAVAREVVEAAMTLDLINLGSKKILH